MIFTETAIDGLFIVDIEPHSDDRGMFARSFDAEEFAARGMEATVAQCNISFNHHAGTVRGLHRQFAPHAEAKLVRCTGGAIVDVGVDVRRDSRTFLQHVMVELSAANRRALYLPPYVAHGYQTLVDATEVTYQVSGPYAPGGEEGFRHDDPAFGLRWPRAVTSISQKDAAWPLFDRAAGSSS